MTGYQVRRANIDDLPQLIPLWKSLELPVVDLEKRLTEFQVAESAGTLVGAIGLHIHQHEGYLHSETFSDFGLAEQLRPLLWERMERVAKNHGIFRVWTQETAPFWKHAFRPASKEQLAQRPPTFPNNEKFEWSVAQLRDAAAHPIDLEKEFAQFKETERARSEEMMSQAKILKGVAVVLSLLVLAFSLVILFKYVLYKPRNQQNQFAPR
jgi:N-acetylglutamate synthase-like GNAT family acetyltransferase